MIKKVKGGYAATSRSGRRLSKRPKSEQGALKQLYAVEASKARRRAGRQRLGKRTRKRVSKRTYGRYAGRSKR